MAEDLQSKPSKTPRLTKLAGTSRAYILHRLRKAGRADLIEAIEAGEISALAVAIELGWARRRPTLGTGSTNQARLRQHRLTLLMGKQAAKADAGASDSAGLELQPASDELPLPRLDHWQLTSLWVGEN